MTLSLALLTVGLAQADPGPIVVTSNSVTIPLESPNLADGIQVVPVGSHVILLGPEGRTSFILPGKYWLLPDAQYREAIIKAKQLAIYQPALDRCTEESLAWQGRVFTALETCSKQFDVDEDLIDSLTDEVRSLETRALVAEDRLKDVRHQRNVAWAITGGLVVGAVAVTAVAIAP
jgi:hypothetical protein